jgi:ABC-type branched-subunit amino acid transport system substrate-binding protein
LQLDPRRALSLRSLQSRTRPAERASRPAAARRAPRSSGWLSNVANQAQKVVKIAYIDPLSGAFANVGEHGLKQFRFAADEINKKNLAGGFKLEVVGFDNKTSPQVSLNVLK